MRYPGRNSLLFPLSSFAFIALLTGCASSFDPTENPVAPVTTPMNTISGSVYGGRQPIVGSKVFLLASNTTGSGGNSLSLIKSTQTGALKDQTVGSPTNGDYYVLTDATGSFALSGNTCTSGQQVYLYSQGGVSTTGGADNPQIGLMAVLGDCPAGLSFDSGGFIYMSELTTVAASYAIAGFATDSTHVSYSGSPRGLVGIRNAFANAAQLNNVHSPTQSALATTPSGNGTVPQSLVNALANVLISCVNSANTASSTTTPCNTLRAYATSDGVQGTLKASGSANSGFAADAPTDTASAMINLVHYPYSANVTTIFNLAQTSGAGIFTPALATAPVDFTVQLLFTGANALSHAYHSLAVDVNGNVYGCGSAAGRYYKFTPLGVASSPLYLYGGASSTVGCALDSTSSYLYFIGNDSSGAATNIIRVPLAGGSDVIATPSFESGASLADIAIDGSGNLWVTDVDSNGGNGAVYKLDAAGTLTSTLPGTGSNGVYSPSGVAIQAGATGNVWLANYSDAGVLTNANAYSADYVVSLNYVQNDAIDSSGNVWLLGDSAALAKLNGTTGAEVDYTETTASHVYLHGLAIDGGNNVWSSGSFYANSTYNNPILQELTTAGARLGPAVSFSTVGPASEIDSVVIDPSGNVWYNSQSDQAVREVLGSGVPTTVPLSYAVANSKLGQRP